MHRTNYDRSNLSALAVTRLAMNWRRRLVSPLMSRRPGLSRQIAIYEAAPTNWSANSFLGLTQCFDTFFQAEAFVIRQGRVKNLEAPPSSNDARQRERHA